jgi:hypothetical protein
MAALFKEMLGPMLICEPLNKDATRYPSPAQLLRRIIIKHRKIDASDATDRLVRSWNCRTMGNPCEWLRKVLRG